MTDPLLVAIVGFLGAVEAVTDHARSVRSEAEAVEIAPDGSGKVCRRA